MTTYRIQIEATVQAKNLSSAQRKLDEIKERVKRTAECSEVRLKGERA